MIDAVAPYRQMALNNAWANATLYAALADMDAVAFTAPRPGFFPSLSATLNHIYEVDLYYLDALEDGGLGLRVFDRENVTVPAELGASQADADMRLAMFCHGMDADVPDDTRQTDRREGQVTERVGDILLHLFQHQIHHRGQAHVQLQHAGLAPPQLDEFHLAFERASTALAYLK